MRLQVKGEFQCRLQASESQPLAPEFSYYLNTKFCPFALFLRLFGNSVPYTEAIWLSIAGNGNTQWTHTNSLLSHTQSYNLEWLHIPAQCTWLPELPLQVQNVGMKKAALTVGHRKKAASSTLQLVKHLTWLLLNDFGTSPAYITYWYCHPILSPSRCNVLKTANVSALSSKSSAFHPIV